MVFLSPAFPTASHVGAPGLGPLRWAVMAQRGGPRIQGAANQAQGICTAALGGVDGRSVRRLPARFCHAIGAIGALGIDEQNQCL